jgi:glycosyltransferase involved in cell wall biosynthesis
MPEPPEVTIVIPTRDRWPMLATNALPSALRQEDVDLELIVVDDGSRDQTARELAALDDPRLTTIRHETAVGVAAARNAGLRSARGRWIAFLDDDDVWSPRKLRIQLELAASTSADFVFAAAVLVDSAMAVLAPDVEPDTQDLARRLRHGNVVPGGCSNVLALTALVRGVGGFDEALSYTEDWDLWIRLAQVGTAASCAEVLVGHVEHGSSALFRYRPDVLGEVEAVVRKHGGDRSAAVGRDRRRGVLAWLADEHERAGFRTEAARMHLKIAREHRSVTAATRALRVLSRRGGAVGNRKVSAQTAPEWLERFRGAAAASTH